MRTWRSPLTSGHFGPRAQLDTSAPSLPAGSLSAPCTQPLGSGLPCPFRALTGWDCPLCGGTRMGDALLHGDVPAAFGFNPLALVGLLILGVLGVLWTVEAVGGPAFRLPRPLAERLRRVRPTQWLVVGLLVAVIYTIARNLL